MKVRCIIPGFVLDPLAHYLEVGKVYEAEEKREGEYHITFRNNEAISYSKEHFELLPEEPASPKFYDIPMMARVTAGSHDEAITKLQTFMDDPRNPNALPVEVNNLFHLNYDKDNSGQLVYYSGAFEWADNSIHDEEEPAPTNDACRECGYNLACPTCKGIPNTHGE